MTDQMITQLDWLKFTKFGCSIQVTMSTIKCKNGFIPHESILIWSNFYICVSQSTPIYDR